MLCNTSASQIWCISCFCRSTNSQSFRNEGKCLLSVIGYNSQRHIFPNNLLKITWISRLCQHFCYFSVWDSLSCVIVMYAVCWSTCSVFYTGVLAGGIEMREYSGLSPSTAKGHCCASKQERKVHEPQYMQAFKFEVANASLEMAKLCQMMSWIYEIYSTPSNRGAPVLTLFHHLVPCPTFEIIAQLVCASSRNIFPVIHPWLSVIFQYLWQCCRNHSHHSNADRGRRTAHS